MMVRSDRDKPHRCPVCGEIPDEARKHGYARWWALYTHCGARWWRGW